MIVGVAFEQPDLAARWVEHLTPLLPEHEVVDASRIGWEGIQVLVVGNPPGESLHRYPDVRFIQSTWAGVDRLVAGPSPVPLARTVDPGLTRSMVEFVEMAVLMLHREVPRYGRQQQARVWRPTPQEDSRPRVGIAGFGELGRPVAEVLALRGYEVRAWARSERIDPIRVLAGEAGWVELLGGSDILVNLLPLTPATSGLYDRGAFAAMKRGIGFVNVARGGHVVEADLLEAINSGQVGEAILDVFEDEPLAEDSPWWSHPNVMVFPHVSAFSRPSSLAPHIAANIRRFCEGSTPAHLVEPIDL